MKEKWLKSLNLPESYVSIMLGLLVVIVAGLILYNNIYKQEDQEVVEKSQEVQEITEEQIEEAFPATHTVQANENLWKIAERYYNSGYNWSTLAQANNIVNPDHIEIGQELTIPEAETITAETGRVSSQQVKTYTVVRGDSLWKIALSEYGDGYQWVKIAQENNLANPNIIHAGNILRIPQ